MSNELTRIRVGKTERERKSGVHQNRFKNRDLRVEWQNQDKGDGIAFPKYACNGKRNRHRWTGKGNKAVIL